MPTLATLFMVYCCFPYLHMYSLNWNLHNYLSNFKLYWNLENILKFFYEFPMPYVRVLVVAIVSFLQANIWHSPKEFEIEILGKWWHVVPYSLALTFPLVQVAERFIAAVHESSNPPSQMSFFINYNAEDILRQAYESTLRYEQGTCL